MINFIAFICLFFINANTVALDDSELTKKISFIIKQDKHKGYQEAHKEIQDFYKNERFVLWYGGMTTGSLLTLFSFSILWKYEWIRVWWENE